ncbi:MAG TPA: stressosome-associated protein Prli42 [Bacillota bacterium]
MSTKQTKKSVPRKKSKRERRVKLMVYVMIIAMVLSSITTGLVYFL